MKVYKGIRKELKSYGNGLDEKEEVIVLTKTDIVSDEKLVAKKIKEFEKLGKKVLSVTLYDNESVKKLGKEILAELKK